MNMSNEDQTAWHKCLCLTFRKLGIVEMLITDQDIEPLNALEPDDMPAMIMESAEDGLHLRIVTMAEARAYSEAVQAEQPSIYVPSDQKIVMPH